MRVITGDLWDVKVDFIGIPTNGSITAQFRAVMGRGVALQAKKRFPGIEFQLGYALKQGGNHLHWLGPGLFSFPVKHNWWERADLELIARSARELKALAERMPNHTFAIPLVGTGNGKRKAEEVWPFLVLLPDNVFIVLKEEKPETRGV